MSNRSTGTHFEQEFCELMFNRGWWVHNMAQNQAGQPADVIAVRNQIAYLIDCKVCEHDEFPLSRIEPNQRSAMNLWEKSCNDCGWFALKMSDDSVWMISLPELDKLALMGYKKLKESDIKYVAKPFEDWVEDIF